MISAYEHGQNAAKHAKHIQARPFDTGTTEWGEWRAGFRGLSQKMVYIVASGLCGRWIANKAYYHSGRPTPIAFAAV
jgi:hypothetical protein